MRLPRHRSRSLLTQQYTRTTRITNLNTSTNHITASQPIRTVKPQRVHVQQLAQVWSQSCGSLGTDVVLCSHNNTHAPHESRISTRPQTTPQRHNPVVPPRFNVCMFNSLPRCGAKAAAPSSPILFPAHATIHTHHTHHESQHVHKPHHSAQPMHTCKAQRVHVQQLAQVWSQSCGSRTTDVVACSRNNTHAPHESRISTRPQTTPQRRTSKVQRVHV